MTGISKAFFGVRVLYDVDFDLFHGEVHVLLGQNGAGKSTLIKILSGAYSADAGVLSIEGKQINLHGYGPSEAEHRGIITIYQNFHVIPHLTVAENLSLHHFVENRGFIKWREVKRYAREVLSNLNFPIDPGRKVYDLPVSQKQMLEIAIALSKNAKILIMDEPTAALSTAEVSRLFETIRQLKRRKIGIIYISHKLEEIREIGDRVTVLRDGAKIATVDPEKTDIREIISLMIGKELIRERTYGDYSTNPPIFEVRELINDNLKSPVSFSMRKNEILGITGLVGAGKTELARAIFGADTVTGGHIEFAGKDFRQITPQKAVSHGFGYLPEDRDSDGLCLNMGLKENLSLALLSKLSKYFIRKGFDRSIARSVVDAIGVKASGLSQKVKYLSGGNKQKVIFGKWFKADCSVLLLDEPTIGIDVGARDEIYELIREFARRDDRGVIIFSSDMDEILEIADRIIVMAKGRVVKELSPETTSKKELMEYSVTTGGY
jgi:ribose transport system ATP-binding protein